MRTLRRAILLLVVVGLMAVVGVGTALAQTPTPTATSTPTPTPKYQGLVGTIKSVSPDGKSFVLTTKDHGDVTISVNAQTKYKVPGLKEATLLPTFKAGVRAAVLVDANNLALHVHLIPGKPTHQHGVGTIKEYVAGNGGHITLLDKKGNTSTFVVTAATKIKFTKGATAVTGQAHVIARRDPATDQFTATEIVVFGPKGPPPGKGGGKP